MKIVIETITEWEKDGSEVEGSRSHGGLSESDVLLELARETKDKKESEWTRGLPFTWECDVRFDVDAVADVGKTFRSYLDDALEEYSDRYCSGDYLKPTGFEGRVVA